jgi:hypothetical protein|tara:strand:+ start:3441 stop:4043 length:603 start_codon:yes stop_codon:yes gene_type:complete
VTVRIEFSFLFLFFIFLLSSCASIEELDKYSNKNTSKTDLNGSWEFIGNFEDNKKSIASAVKKTNDVIYQSIKTTGVFDRNNLSKVKPNSRGVAHLFFENSKKIKITQTNYSLFINFNRSIVEEYSFGEVKKITLGNVIARRSSGWVNNSYRIETLDDYGMKITEEYKLTGSSNNLERMLIFRDRDLNEIRILQIYQKDN